LANRKSEWGLCLVLKMEKNNKLVIAVSVIVVLLILVLGFVPSMNGNAVLVKGPTSDFVGLDSCLQEKCGKYQSSFFRKICENRNRADCMNERFGEDDSTILKSPSKDVIISSEFKKVGFNCYDNELYDPVNDLVDKNFLYYRGAAYYWNGDEVEQDECINDKMLREFFCVDIGNNMKILSSAQFDCQEEHTGTGPLPSDYEGVNWCNDGACFS